MWKTWSLMQFKAMQHQGISIQQQPLQSFQLFTYGSGQISNSCHTDKFLESLFESFIRQISPISLREQGKFRTIKDDTVEFLAKQHNKWIQKFSSGRNGINFSDIWCTITKNVEQRKGCTFHETFTDHSMLKSAHHQHYCTTTNSLYFLHSGCINIMDISNLAYDPVNIV